jgi:hypothetical protein
MAQALFCALVLIFATGPSGCQSAPGRYDVQVIPNPAPDNQQEPVEDYTVIVTDTQTGEIYKGKVEDLDELEQLKGRLE